MLNVQSFLINFPFTIQNCIDFSFLNNFSFSLGFSDQTLLLLLVDVSNLCVSLDLALVFVFFTTIIPSVIPFAFFAGKALTDKIVKAIQIGAGSVIIGRGAIDGYNAWNDRKKSEDGSKNGSSGDNSNPDKNDSGKSNPDKNTDNNPDKNNGGNSKPSGAGENNGQSSPNNSNGASSTDSNGTKSN